MTKWRPEEWNETYYDKEGWPKHSYGEPANWFEAGADAMLETLRDRGLTSLDYVSSNQLRKGTGVFIPDNEPNLLLVTDD